jgi:hypothetical protein
VTGCRDTLAPMGEHRKSVLPRNRAFVVQLAAAGENPDPFHGRIEHLASGQAVRFDSLGRLREFVERVLAEVADENPER